MATRAERFGTALRKARRKAGLTLRELGEAVGWDHSTISKYEQLERKTVPEPEIVEQLEAALGISDGQLLEAAGYAPTTAPRQSLSYGGEELTAEEEERVIEYIKFLRTQRDT